MIQQCRGLPTCINCKSLDKPTELLMDPLVCIYGFYSMVKVFSNKPKLKVKAFAYLSWYVFLQFLPPFQISFPIDPVKDV